MPHEHLAVSAFVVVHGALNSVFVSLLILIELSMYSRIANVAELSPFRLQQSGSWTKRVLCTIKDKLVVTSELNRRWRRKLGWGE